MHKEQTREPKRDDRMKRPDKRDATPKPQPKYDTRDLRPQPPRRGYETR
jgi:hypothetical protein